MRSRNGSECHPHQKKGTKKAAETSVFKEKLAFMGLNVFSAQIIPDLQAIELLWSMVFAGGRCRFEQDTSSQQESAVA